MREYLSTGGVVGLYVVCAVSTIVSGYPVEMNVMKRLIVKLYNLEQPSHNIESLKQRLKALCECIESSMHAHGDSHEFSKLRIPGCLQTDTHFFIQHIQQDILRRSYGVVEYNTI